MKKLICAKDIETLIVNGKKAFLIDGSEIITPAAKELAVNNQIVFTTEDLKEEVQSTEKKETSNLENIDSEMLMKLFKAMMEKGILQELIECLKPKNALFDAECDENGLKVVRGNTVKMDVFDTGNKDARVYFQELVSKEESKMSAGFLIIEDSKFEWELTYEEIDYVIEGTLTVEINGKTYTAHKGDVLFVPSGSKVVWGSPDKARLFYATYPANWADLL
ncbi:cupin domain-containing protein [Clostridium ihumii]|uniref:cupin domain-containing protein n=1 Tax=Clostridium ihumii TaxID=1470356 RepID=UPI0005910A34|nr:cupin domain-containing protein [Clostridium ihumii]